MSETRIDLVRCLQDGCWHSGTTLARRLGVSRAAVWKHIGRLREWGLEIHVVRGAGYRLAQPLELLDGERIRAFLDAGAQADVAVEIFPVLDSTNAYLMACPLDAGVRVCLAEYQRAGRGRRGRRWVSPFGVNVYMSIGWRFVETPAGFAALPLAVGVACAAFLRELGVGQVAVKWPNDLLLAGRKLGGILVEHRGEAGGPWQVVIGVGLNLGMDAGQSGDIDQPWTSLIEAWPAGRSDPPSRNRVAAGLIGAMLDVREAFRHSGFEPFRRRWPEFDAVRDRAVSVRTPTGAVNGIARGIDADGALLLDTGAGRRRVFSGEVSLRLE